MEFLRIYGEGGTVIGSLRAKITLQKFQSFRNEIINVDVGHGDIFLDVAGMFFILQSIIDHFYGVVSGASIRHDWRKNTSIPQRSKINQFLISHILSHSFYEILTNSINSLWILRSIFINEFSLLRTVKTVGSNT